jgi:anthranilate phosphoribosyltransferase
MSLAPFVQIVARGKGRARPMTLAEAQEAMTLILQGDAAPEAVGALLMVMRLRGETPAEIAGFTAALRAHVDGKLPKADLDWPSYAAGRSRGAPLFLLAARLVGQAGYRVSMHGWNSHQSTRA